MLGGNDVSDVKRGIEVALKELDRTFGDVYGNEAGHIELQYTARASYALEKAFGAPLGRACGIIVGAPASVGVLMADTALKSANVEVVAYSSPAHGTSFSNEAILGDFRRLRRGAPGGDLRPGNRQNRTGDAGRRTEKRSPLLHLIPARLIHEIEKI
ncbi:propanediol utilization polyhedral body protein PduB [Klebsiella pneumoniae]|uniref:Propanediol utilization polyhedral body protein PduB n=1 Tax=Klebsiella pneumoniae TaxID=573 RepID=A0A377TZF1_KLEPN|nr:propanediol utilization polyhedral body protein PduB [Klebsiella pneumoniae]